MGDPVRLGIDIGSESLKAVLVDNDKYDEIGPFHITGKPLPRLLELVEKVLCKSGPDTEALLGITGSCGEFFARMLDVELIPEPQALASAFGALAPDIRQVIEMGAQSQKFLSFTRDEDSGRLMVDDVITGGKCAGGTGSFLSYMQQRLKYDSMEEFTDAAVNSEPAGISGRCAVFAESDIVHHYQKGTPRDRIASGLHQAAARNFKALVRRGGISGGRIAFIGGVAKNKAAVKHLEKEMGLEPGSIVVPAFARFACSYGAAYRAKDFISLSRLHSIIKENMEAPFEYNRQKPISMSRSKYMESPPPSPDGSSFGLVSLGVDIGSVSTKAALVGMNGSQLEVLAWHYRRTDGNPLEAVKATVGEIKKQVEKKGYKLDRIIAGTTGSGRYLTGYFLGADKVTDEITAQAAGVHTFLKEKDFSVIELGGQDSKFIQIKDGVITDFEMNWACAAGTGALIEKHSRNLDIPVEEFGDYALRAGNPPVFNSTCAVFSEQGLITCQQNNVDADELCAGACLASASNYLIKVVRQRPLSDKVAFQGAVAFNKGMVASFETLLDRPVTVPPYPHLTGAIGVARLALDSAFSSKDSPSFRGFDAVLSTDYVLDTFQCGKCGNECHINRFRFGDKEFFQGDRCDRYSSRHKKSLGADLPDLFEERDRLLHEFHKAEAPADAPVIGIPRGMLYADYFLMFRVFFNELGFRVVDSPPTSQRLIQKGLEKVVAEPCFPVKVLHGHARHLLDSGVDYIFTPSIETGEEIYGGFEDCQTCPYIQGGPDVLASSISENGRSGKFLKPALFMNRGFRHLRRALGKLLKKLGKSQKEVDKALRAALSAHEDFKNKIAGRGKQVLEELGDKMAFVIIGRPYGIYDPALNMNIVHKIRDEGYLAIPIDLLPLKDIDVSDHWKNVYPVQGQKKLAAARYIAKHKNLHALVLTYFGCGPDAFLDQMFKEELGGHYLTIQIDEHTSDTGVLTRIQAYLNAAKSNNRISIEKEIRAHDTSLAEVKGKRLWIPYMCEGAKVLAAVMRGQGIDARVLPRSKDPGLDNVRKHIYGDVCLPMLHTTEDMLQRAGSSDFNPEKEAFFQGKSHGPCRFGMYFMLEKMLLDSLHGKVEICTLGDKNASSGLGTFFTMAAWDSLVSYDILEKMLLRTRPYEKNKGETDELFNRYVDDLAKLAEEHSRLLNGSKMQLAAVLGKHLDKFKEFMSRAQKDFSSIEKTGEDRPVVGLVGEFYVRAHPVSNHDIIRRLESLGCEVRIAPMTEFFGYSNYIGSFHAGEKWLDTGKLSYLIESKARGWLTGLALRDERAIFETCLPLLSGCEEISPEEVVDLGDRYVTRYFGGEAILSLGKAQDFASGNMDGIVSVGPFNCMPSLIVSAISRELRRMNDNIPFLNVDFDGYEDSARDARIAMFAAQVKERHEIKKAGVGKL
ncbi:MAG: acyl-CoA dehydratase activase [Chloroflexi bacterium]|nr:acyl-CoA dehydratase activase [Chloroflexota bacterium]